MTMTYNAVASSALYFCLRQTEFHLQALPKTRIWVMSETKVEDTEYYANLYYSVNEAKAINRSW